LREEQRASGATVVMVSSDLDRMLPVTDRIGMMYQGQLIFDGTTDEARRSSNPYVYQFVNGLTEGPL
jgi:phospholipid/cholesterol/gamma-HCH transport system ATP-binding protein